MNLKGSTLRGLCLCKFDFPWRRMAAAHKTGIEIAHSGHPNASFLLYPNDQGWLIAQGCPTKTGNFNSTGVYNKHGPVQIYKVSISSLNMKFWVHFLSWSILFDFRDVFALKVNFMLWRLTWKWWTATIY